MKRGKKEKQHNNLEISPADYVIDLLRCTIEVDDPYLVAVIFHVLLKEKVAPCLRVCRLKNKFVSEIEDHKQTNLLINLALLYPHDENEFKISGLKGTFNDKMCGKCVLVCELYITMKDFLLIKVCFCYYFIVEE